MMEYQPKITQEEINEYPIYLYEGRIKVIDRPEEVESAVNFLRGYSCIGFDTETRPAFKKGEFHYISLVQLACEECVFLFRIQKCGFPISLRRFFEEERIIKVGVGIRDDVRSLRLIQRFEPYSFVDLQNIGENFGIKEKSFSKMMAILFQVHISKRQRTTNWEAEELTQSQVLYAATDAWGALMMYKKLLEMR